MKHVIAFTGYRRIGKTLLTTIIANKLFEYNISCRRLSFASLLRDCVEQFFGSDAFFHSKNFKNKQCKIILGKRKFNFPWTYRDLLIKTGDYLRDMDINIFAREVTQEIKNSSANVFIIDDLRFDNELIALRNLEADPNIKVHIISLKRYDNSAILQSDIEARDYISEALCDWVFFMKTIDSQSEYEVTHSDELRKQVTNLLIDLGVISG